MFNVLVQSRQPLSPKELFARIGSSSPGIGLTTVYRTLESFANVGLVRRTSTPCGDVKFEYNRGDQHHRHLVCTRCQKTVNCPNVERDELDIVRRSEALLADRYGFLITDHTVDFMGLCPDCRPRAARSEEIGRGPAKEGRVMRIAIATDEDYVAAGFGCAPFCTIVDLDDSGRIRQTTLVPNPGHSHSFWADLCFRNSIRFVVAGSMGPSATSTLRGRGIEPIVGVTGRIDDVARRFAAGELAVTREEALQAR